MLNPSDLRYANDSPLCWMMRGRNGLLLTSRTEPSRTTIDGLLVGFFLVANLLKGRLFRVGQALFRFTIWLSDWTAKSAEMVP